MIVSKYHGCGNDFIITRFEDITTNHSDFAQQVCDRHTGIGADGLIIVKQHPLEMIFYNCDGSRAPMCGNGIRCFACYVHEEQVCGDDEFDVVTLAGIMHVKILEKDPFQVEIRMGKAAMDASLLHIQNDQVLWNYPIEIQHQTRLIDTCFMGTIHTMVYVEDALDARLEGVGKELHQHPLFLEKTNVNFIQIIDQHTMKVQTYERGVGMTLACGTGCCASVWDAWKKGLVESDVHVELQYGYLDIKIQEDEVIYMSGPAKQIMKGAQVYETNR